MRSLTEAMKSINGSLENCGEALSCFADVVTSGWLQGGAANVAVAWTELIGLQTVQYAQYLLGAASDVEVIDRHMLNDVVRIDDECRAQRYTLLGVTHAKLIDERTGHITELPVIEPIQVLVIAPPTQFAELIVG